MGPWGPADGLVGGELICVTYTGLSYTVHFFTAPTLKRLASPNTDRFRSAAG
jgi:hypothetical protein